MKWHKVNTRKDLPKRELAFVCLWEGLISLAQYDEEEDSYYIIWAPASQVHPINLTHCNSEHDITHLIDIFLPEDYGNPPHPTNEEESARYETFGKGKG